MPDYVTMSDMNARIPGDFLIQALDDNGDGAADTGVWDQVKSAVETDINGTLSKRFKTPFANPVPAFVLKCAAVFAAALLYRRRGMTDDKNPWAKEEETLKKELTAIANGDAPLSGAIEREKPSGTVVGAPSKLNSKKLSV